MYRTHRCGDLNLSHQGINVKLAGWVYKNRNLGGMTFIDLRDRYGITQLAFNMQTMPELCEKARTLGREYVIQVEGVVCERERKNPQLPTGDIEIEVKALKVLNSSPVPPFTIEEETDGGEELRMQYRFLDLRRKPLQDNLMLRHRMLQATRHFLAKKDFLEIETPFLIKSTPEGARDFVVPSRIHEEKFYALPQSPQTFKQLFMMSGFDRYFQIVKCFRDEDFRADRQPEFTQIDCEMAFADQADIIENFSGLVQHLFKEVKGIDIGEIPTMSYDEAIANYGSDKPDLRFDMKINNLNSTFEGTDFKPFQVALADNGVVGALCLKGGAAEYSRKKLDQLTKFVQEPGMDMKGLVWLKYQADGSIKSTVDKFFEENERQTWLESCGAEKGDILFILAGSRTQTLNALGKLRLKLAGDHQLIPEHSFKPLWVVDFPLMELDEETGAYTFAHHPFTMPKVNHLDELDEASTDIKAHCYDFVLNGSELASGSMRIHDAEMQAKVFDLLGIDKAEQEAKFGFLLKALQYGAPPHAGIAFGFDRWCAIFAGTNSIRDVIAFPKNNAGKDLMMDAPDFISEAQRKELHLR